MDKVIDIALALLGAAGITLVAMLAVTVFAAIYTKFWR